MDREGRYVTGSSFEDFLKEEGLYEEVYGAVLKRLLLDEVRQAMRRQGLTKSAIARRMRTSRSQLDRIFDTKNLTIQLDTLMKFAAAMGCELDISLRPIRRRAART